MLQTCAQGRQDRGDQKSSLLSCVQGFPYLNSIVFRVMPDAMKLTQALRTGIDRYGLAAADHRAGRAVRHRRHQGAAAERSELGGSADQYAQPHIQGCKSTPGIGICSESRAPRSSGVARPGGAARKRPAAVLARVQKAVQPTRSIRARRIGCSMPQAGEWARRAAPQRIANSLLRLLHDDEQSLAPAR